MTEKPRYPGYDVLAKMWTPSWDEPTRQAITRRLSVPDVPGFFTETEWRCADALCRRIVPQTGEADAVSLVALLDDKLLHNHGSGFRVGDMPYMREAWQQGLAALDGEAAERHEGRRFADLTDEEQDTLLRAMQQGHVTGKRWGAMGAEMFFKRRVLDDVPGLYYGHPKAWNEMGFGGPASPRGYVRLDGLRRDAWEAAEAAEEGEAKAERANRHVV